ncbi:MAG TPA: peptide chain release factor aRF-1 [Candidatus Bathyarchaeia archaeon]|nr:MAG: peptide chain release factor 1 [Candidatus Bathyarchaeota archaeon RBG_16_48_13]HJX22818.1 peptide chain release factor aRF-1 [Candidatus Bathyarchaeia archaeon]
MPDKSSLSQFRLKRALGVLASKEGRGTELISLYVTPGKQIYDVISQLRQEYTTASNIKSATTRKHVQDAITRTMQRLKLFKTPPDTGLVIFCGALPQNGPGSERIELYVIVPPDPIRIYTYRCDSKFLLDPIREMVKVKEVYGILVMDASGAIFALLKGGNLEIVREITSGVSGKHRAGGQSARRFERLREAELNSFFNRVGIYASEIFLQVPNLKGILVGGPGPTKYDFVDGDHMQYTLRGKVLSIVDTAYVEEQGVEEVVEKSPGTLLAVRYREEKQAVQKFLYELGHGTGLATYGEEEVRRSLKGGIAQMLLLSAELKKTRLYVKCQSCDHREERTVSTADLHDAEDEIKNTPCPKCNNKNMVIDETKDLVDDFADMAEQAGTDIEIITKETAEGEMLRDSFGGIAAILRFKQSQT